MKQYFKDIKMFSVNSTINLTLVVWENCSGVNGACKDLYDDRLGINYVVVMSTVLVVIFATSIIGNVSVFIIFYKKPALVTISNRFIVNLSVCNILETVIVMPFVFVALINQEWVFGVVWCQITGFIMNTVFSATTLTLVIIAIDRYCAVVTPLHYSLRMTNTRACFLIASVWFVSVLCSTPPLVGWNRYVYQRHKMSCMPVTSHTDVRDVIFVMCLVTLCFILPLIVILRVYCVIFRAAKVNNDKVRRNSTISNMNDVSDVPIRPVRRGSSAQILIHRLSVSTKSNNLIWRRDEWKTAVTSFMVLFTFILSWLLYFIVIILECFVQNPSRIDGHLKALSVILALSSCAWNPMVYVFRSKLQRIELKSVIGFKQNTNYGHLQYAGSRRASTNFTSIRSSPCITREGSEESDVVEILHHVNTTTTLASMVPNDA